jgi:hypothetical protein
MIKSTPLTPFLALCGLVLALTPGCKQAVHCPELSGNGGPVPIGTWTLTPAVGAAPAHGSCIEDLYVPVSDPRLVGGGDVPAARTPPPEPSLYDWCDNLVTSSGTMISTHDAIFYPESAPVAVASIKILADGSWTSGITRTGVFVLDFPALCMREFGAMDGRPVDPTNPAAGTGDVCAQLQVKQRKTGLGTGAYQNTTCLPNTSDPGGCTCWFEDQETGGPSGYYRQIDGNTLEFLSDKNFPNLVTYSNDGGTSLELTGKDGEYLFGTRGLRTMDLAISNCMDGIQGPYEQGVDCGGQCSTPCGAAAPAPAAPAPAAPAPAAP